MRVCVCVVGPSIARIINRMWYRSISSWAPALKTSTVPGILVCVKADILHLLRSAAQDTAVCDRWGWDGDGLPHF